MEESVRRSQVSVIVPTYNRAYCLCATIDSVVAQTHADWELLLVDDGSTDGTRQLLEEVYGGEPRIRYLYQANGGVSHARNTGIAAVRGEFVAFLDSDDVWMPWKLEVQLACLARFEEAGMVWTDMEAVDPQDVVVGRRHLRTMYSAYRHFKLEDLFARSERLVEVTSAAPDPEARVYAGDIYGAMILGSLVHTSTVLMRRSRLERVGGFDETLKVSGEDYDFHLRTCSHGPVALIDVASIQYRVGRPDHLSHASYYTSINFLSTVQRAIAAEGGSGRFSQERIRGVLAEAHGWVAETSLQRADRRAARGHALRSLRLRPLQPR